MRVLVWLALLCGVAARAAQVTYHRLDLGNEGQYGIFSDDLDGDGRGDIVALALGRISVYRADPRQEAGYAPSPESLVTGALAFYADVADVLPDKGKEILILTTDGIMAFVQEGGRFLPKPRSLLQCQTIMSMNAVRQAAAGDAEREPVVPVLPWNFAFDADGDGRDDIIVPSDKGTDVYLQKAPGQFAASSSRSSRPPSRAATSTATGGPTSSRVPTGLPRSSTAPLTPTPPGCRPKPSSATTGPHSRRNTTCWT
jgi:hypothetical protein